MLYAAVDIGTNSMRLLIASEGEEVLRAQKVTGLGKGLDARGELAADAVERTLAVLAGFGDVIRSHQVRRSRAVATSACRDASNGEAFLERAAQALGVRPEVITGEEEAALSFAGATADAPGEGPYMVVDIGGGSTEFVWQDRAGLSAKSVDIGSVRLTDRLLQARPVDFEHLVRASNHVTELFGEVGAPVNGYTVIGVAGTWTSLVAISLGLSRYDRELVHHSMISRLQVDRLVERLASLTVEETATIPSLDPARAPVILGGAVVARESMRHLRAPEVLISEHDLLDGVVARLQAEAAG